MVRTIYGAGLAVLFGMVSTLAAQNGKYTATVILPEIEMRSGHSWQFPATGKLKKGEQVVVHHEEDNWIAILPPPGSTSWIQARFLGKVNPNHPGKQNVEVVCDPAVKVEVRVGNAKGAPLGIYQVKLPRGTIVEVLGPGVKDDNSTWYPITPPEGEYRWVPKESLGSPAPLASPPAFVKGSGEGDKTVSLRRDDKATPDKADPLTRNQLFSSATWEKAEQAEKAGNYAQAEQLYTQIYQDLRQKSADPELQLVCYNRIVRCQERLRLDGGRVNTNLPNPTPQSNPNQPSAILQQPSGQNPKGGMEAWPTGGSSGTRPTAREEAPGTGTRRWTGLGNLRRAGFLVDSRQAYALEDSRGKVLFYVTAGPGINLERYVNQQVDLYGVVQTRGDIRGGAYMMVLQINPSSK